MKTLATISLLCCVSSISVAQNNGISASQALEIATLDAVATTLGSTQSWIRNEPEAAAHLFADHQKLLEYANAKIKQYGGGGRQGYSQQRIQDRVKQLEQGIKHWNDVVPRYKASTPAQIASELKRQRDAVARYQKAKRPRPSSFAYIPKTAWETKTKLQVLTASGVDTTDLLKQQKEIETQILELIASIDAAELAKSTNTPRDRYRRDDRASIDKFVTQEWKRKHNDTPIAGIVIPQQSWSNVYGATFNKSANRIAPFELDRMTVYVAVKKAEEILTLHPMRLVRENFKVNGKLFNKPNPGPLKRIPSNEVPFDVLTKNVS